MLFLTTHNQTLVTYKNIQMHVDYQLHGMQVLFSAATLYAHVRSFYTAIAMCV